MQLLGEYRMAEWALRWDGRVRTNPWAGPLALDREAATSPHAPPTIPHDADVVADRASRFASVLILAAALPGRRKTRAGPLLG